MSESDSTRTFDVRALHGMPTPILHAIYLGVQRELTRRRAMDAVSRKKVLESTAYKPLHTEKFKYSKHRLNELDDLMAQDWSHLFPDGDGEPKYYVYAHVYPFMKPKDFRHDGAFKMDLPGMPFYVGKGCGERAWDLKRNEGHGVELRQLLSRGNTPEQIVHVVRDKLSERAALEIESKLIYFFGTKFERDRRGLLVNLEIPRRPF
jgi:hypothetical protein